MLRSLGSKPIQWALLGVCTMFITFRVWKRLKYRPSPPVDTVLSFDVADEDCLYRIQRHCKHHGTRGVYVWLKWPDLIPEEYRTYGPSVIRHLSKLDEWNGGWETLIIDKDDAGRLQVLCDAFPPHRVSEDMIIGSYPAFNVFDLKDVKEVKSRTHSCRIRGKKCFVKSARFAFEIPALEREISAYYSLIQYKSKLAPGLVGFVYEGNKSRIIGFATEEVAGRYPTIDDYDLCDEALQKLHGLGIVHGDVNIYNMIVMRDGIKLLDFEEARIDQRRSEAWAQLAQDERQTLRERLSDTSGIGKPWD
ncbi:hypothetical protein VHEMI09168 [[Torrubiella] hemipterigena]|uniref:Alpha-galactosidase A n=1 Tax=[Torrubiella] hemipterigena TaxID=1531966 RepID=A0A0A1TPJ1_9HYPO|nr:hypothetical protein VHEMI09168 [[Torrubiella] hemipterigena]